MRGTGRRHRRSPRREGGVMSYCMRMFTTLGLAEICAWSGNVFGQLIAAMLLFIAAAFSFAEFRAINDEHGEPPK